MTYLKVYGDGTTYPALRREDLVICLICGSAAVGYFRRINKPPLFFEIDKLKLPNILLEEIQSRLLQENPSIFEKKHPVYLLCPADLCKIIKLAMQQISHSA